MDDYLEMAVVHFRKMCRHQLEMATCLGWIEPGEYFGVSEALTEELRRFNKELRILIKKNVDTVDEYHDAKGYSLVADVMERFRKELQELIPGKDLEGLWDL